MAVAVVVGEAVGEAAAVAEVRNDRERSHGQTPDSRSSAGSIRAFLRSLLAEVRWIPVLLIHQPALLARRPSFSSNTLGGP